MQILLQCIDERGVEKLLSSGFASTSQSICPENRECQKEHTCVTQNVELIEQCPILDDYVQRNLESSPIVEKTVSLASHTVKLSNLVNGLLHGKVESLLKLRLICHTRRFRSLNC